MSIQYYRRENAGSSVSFEKTFLKTLKNSLEKGMYSIQFFLGSYISMNRSKITDDDFKDSNNLLKRYKINVFTHLPYVLNLCGKAGKLENECKEALNHTENSVNSIIYELDVISKLIKDTNNKGGCVLHIGSIGTNKNRKGALDIVIQNVNKILYKIEKGNSKLILETMVGRGGVIGNTFEELFYIYSQIENKDRVGICIDTCHIHAEGLYRLDTIENIDKLFNDFLELFPIDKLSLIHLNDSCFEFNCGKDRHQSLLNGHIWKQKTLYYFIDRLEILNIPYVLETTEDDYLLLQL
jgi:deoxyribonuclease IV